ncbi:hypothetical protein D3C87_1224660 [compost metagenome]
MAAKGAAATTRPFNAGVTVAGRLARGVSVVAVTTAVFRPMLRDCSDVSLTRAWSPITLPAPKATTSADRATAVTWMDVMRIGLATDFPWRCEVRRSRLVAGGAETLLTSG